MDRILFFQSERLVYRPLRQEDLPTIVRQRNEATMRRWFYFLEPDCLTERYAQKLIEDTQATWRKMPDILRDACDLGIYRKDTGELIGDVGLSKQHVRSPEAPPDLEIGYHIAEAYEGQGFGTEAAKAAIAWAFARLRELGAEPVVRAYIEHGNQPSARVAEKAGFTYERDEEYVTVYAIRG